MADYATAYSNVTGYVYGCWLRTTSDNISTAAGDGHLTVDSVKVMAELGSASDLAFILLTAPTAADVEAGHGVLEVDVAGAPTNMTERGDGARDPKYPFA